MIAAIVLVLIIPVLIYYYYKKAYERPPNFPPGPPSLPVYGALWIILMHEFSNLSLALVKLGKKYKTDILGFHLSSIPVVVVNSPALVREVLNREEFDGRMDIILSRLRSYWKRLGVFFTDGYFWHTQRRFSLRFMRDYGFGRRDKVLEEVVANEIKEMIDMSLNGPKYPAEKEIVNGDLIYLPHYFAVPFMNGVLHVIARTTLPRPEYKALWDVAKGALMFQRSSNDMGGALSLTPWLKNVLPNYSGYNGLYNGNQYILEFFEELLKEVLATHDESYNRHFLDMYITKMKQETRQKKRTTYSVEQLTLICADYMFPAATAVESALTMLVDRLLQFPEVQDKIHEEIDRVVGRDRLPNLDDRQYMPYTEACIREAQRFDTLVTLSVPHRAMKNTKLAGYDIPEGAMVSPNLAAMHMDKTLWGDPDNFRPERFIENGKLNVALDKSLPFGAGRRLCAGETYARQTMFQVFTAFMQSFRVSPADGSPRKDPAERIQGIITTLPNFWVRATPRF